MCAAPLKILYIAGELTAGGYQRQLHLFLSQLDREKISPVLAVWNYNEQQAFVDDFKQLKIPLYSVGRLGGRYQRQRNLNGIVRTVRPQYMHSFTFYTNFPAWLAAKTLGLDGVIGSFRNNYWSEIRDVGPLFGRLCARYPSQMIANSKAAGEAVHNHQTFFRPDQVWIVSNCVDTVTYCPDNNHGKDKINSQVKLLGVGRLTASKRWEWLLSLLKDLNKSSLMPDWHLTLCGEGEEYANIETQIHALKLENQVTLAGYQKNMSDWYGKSDLLILPSLHEGTPNVVAEALSCGIPVISTDVGDVRELVRDGVDGYIVDLNDDQGFKQRILELMLKPDLRNLMGKNGRKWMLKTRSAHCLLENTMNVYREAGWKI